MWEINGLKDAKLPDDFSGTLDTKQYDVCEATAENPQAVLRPQGQGNASPHVGLADFQISWQTDGSFLGVATFDLQPGGLSICPLQLPSECELVAVSVDGLPLHPQKLDQGEWRLALNSDRLPQRLAVVYRGAFAGAARPGMHSFDAPTLSNTPIAQTLWTVNGPSCFTAGEHAEKKPTALLELNWLRFRLISDAIDQSASLFSEDNEETRRWYRLRMRDWAVARSALVREWLPISQTEAGRSMQKEMESLDRRQLEFAEHLEMSDALRQLLAASPQACEPGQWWSKTLFDPSASACFEQQGTLNLLHLNYNWSEANRTLDYFLYVGGILGTIILAIWGIRKEYWRRIHESVPTLNYAVGAALGLVWWQCLSPSWLGLAIVLVSAASWGWRWQKSRKTAS
jgi:hypothetical protein